MPFGAVIPVTGLNFGFPGTISRAGDPLVVAKEVLATTPNNIPFGTPVVVIPTTGGGDTVVGVVDYVGTGTGQQSGTFTAAKFAGVAVREVKSMLTYPVNPDTPQTGSYAPTQECEFLVRGTISVQIYTGTPASQAAVYVRTVLNASVAPNGIVGGFEAGSLAGNVALTNVVFKNGNVDANGVTEITVLERAAA
jgi:hypothetical protein